MDIKALREEDQATIIEWSSHDSIKNTIFVDDWAQYYRYVAAQAQYWIFGVWQDDKLIGELAAEGIDDHLSVSLIIDPALQGRGLGTAAMRLFVECAASLTQFNPAYVHAAIAPGNIASMRCFEKAQFVNVGKDEDGEYFYKYVL